MENEDFYTSFFLKDKKILIVGVYPPPLGGVSVHIYRLIKLLKSKEYDIDCYDTSKEESFKGQKYFRLFSRIILGKYDIIHFHENNLIFFKICLFIKKFYPNIEIYLTSHNPRLLKFNTKKQLRDKLKFLTRINALIVVGKDILVEYQTYNIKLPEKVFVKNAFIEPPLEEEEKILSTYPITLFKFLKKHSPIVTANAFQISFYNNEDLYGLDMCIEFTAKIKSLIPNIGFVFALANDSVNISYIEKMKSRIKELGINNNFYFLNGQRELWPLLKKCDIVIRPTNTDGDSLSIREAIFFNKPIIASDIVKRPKETILFKTRNLTDLIEKCSIYLK